MYSLGLGVLVFTLVCTLLLAIMLTVSWLVRVGSRESSTYECGIPAEGDHRDIGFNYMQYAALFLVFDLAALYLFLYTASYPFTRMVNITFFTGITMLLLLIFHGTRKRRYYVTSRS